MHLSIQDLIAIVTFILCPIGAMIGFMWHHFNKKFEVIDHKLEKMDDKFDKMDLKIDYKFQQIDEKINSVEKRLSERLGEKIDAVRDRVSRIEGQLAPASFVTFNSPTKNKENIRAAHSS